MSWKFDRVDSDGLSYAGAPALAAPLTFAFWFKADANGLTQRCLYTYENVSNLRFALGLSATNLVGFASQQISPAVAGVAYSTAGWSVDVWNHACGIEYATNSRAAFLNGANKGTERTTVVPANLDRIYLGRGQTANTLSGYLADVAIWNGVALSDAEVALLAAGVSPMRIQRANLVAYWPLLANKNDRLGTYNLSDVNTPTWSADHPRLKRWMGPMNGRGVMRGVAGMGRTT